MSPTHLHAWSAEYRAVVDIRSGNVTSGNLGSRQAVSVKTWVGRHAAELLAAWQRASVPASARLVWPNGLDLAPEVLHGDFEPDNGLGFNDVTPDRQTA